jgi:hypothetical protein
MKVPAASVGMTNRDVDVVKGDAKSGAGSGVHVFFVRHTWTMQNGMDGICGI